MSQGTQPAFLSVVEGAVKFGVGTDPHSPVPVGVKSAQRVGHHTVWHIQTHSLVQGRKIPIPIVGNVGRKAHKAGLDLSRCCRGVLDPRCGALNQSAQAFLEQGAVCSGHALFGLERIGHANAVVPFSRDRVGGKNPRQRQFKSTHIDPQRRHDQIHPPCVAVLVVSRCGSDAHRLAWNGGIVVHTRGEGVGQEVLLRTVELRTEIPTGAKIDIGIEPAIWSGFGVLAVAPPHKELCPTRRTRITCCSARHNARTGQLEIPAEPITVTVLSGSRQAPCSSAVDVALQPSVPMVPQGLVPP